VRSDLHSLSYCFGRALLPGGSVTGQDQGSAGSCYCLQRSKGLPGVVCCCGSDDLRAGLSGVWVEGHQCVPAEDDPSVREVKNAVTVSVARGVYDGGAPGHRHGGTGFQHLRLGYALDLECPGGGHACEQGQGSGVVKGYRKRLRSGLYRYGWAAR
jgi:hypothetical protein